MDIKAYIASGILELYVMDALTPAERREVETLAMQYPEIKENLSRVDHAINSYNLQHAQAPGRDLKAGILAKAKAMDRPEQAPSKANPRTSNGSFWAGWILAALASAFAIVCYFQHQGMAEQYRQGIEQTRILQDAYDQAQQRLDLIANPGTQAVALDGTDLSPQSSVEVFWNSEQQTTLLSIKNLPAPPAGKQYQLWSLLDGQPASAGLIAYELDALQNMDPVLAANTFAITLEDEGGSAQPTLSQLYVIGNI